MVTFVANLVCAVTERELCLGHNLDCSCFVDDSWRRIFLFRSRQEKVGTVSHMALHDVSRGRQLSGSFLVGFSGQRGLCGVKALLSNSDRCGKCY